MIRAGDLKHKVVIQSNTETSDDMGPGGQDVWSDLLPTRAAIWPLSSTEQMRAMQADLKVDRRIRIRHPRTTNVTAGMRIKWRNHMTDEDVYFYIVSIINKDERNVMLDFLTQERA